MAVVVGYVRGGSRLEPTTPNAPVEAGRVYIKLADNAAAIKEFRRALTEKPDLAQAQVLLDNTTKLVQASGASRTVIATAPKDAQLCPDVPPGAGNG